jgi:hypothetical protein
VLRLLRALDDDVGAGRYRVPRHHPGAPVTPSSRVVTTK